MTFRRSRHSSSRQESESRRDERRGKIKGRRGRVPSKPRRRQLLGRVPTAKRPSSRDRALQGRGQRRVPAPAVCVRGGITNAKPEMLRSLKGLPGFPFLWSSNPGSSETAGFLHGGAATGGGSLFSRNAKGAPSFRPELTEGFCSIEFRYLFERRFAPEQFFDGSVNYRFSSGGFYYSANGICGFALRESAGNSPVHFDQFKDGYFAGVP